MNRDKYNELERLLMENLRYAKRNNELLQKVDGYQRFSRNWTIFYWTVLIIAAVGGYFYAFPYLKTVRDDFFQFTGQVTEAVKTIAPMGK